MKLFLLLLSSRTPSVAIPLQGLIRVVEEKSNKAKIARYLILDIRITLKCVLGTLKRCRFNL